MKHHQYNRNFKFVKRPIEFNKLSDKELLAHCLGATLYMPGTKDILSKILNKNFDEITSMVMCFEDAIKFGDLAAAETNVLNHLDKLSKAVSRETLTYDDIPLIFVRVRNVEQFRAFSLRLAPEHLKVLSGFVFPKFYSYNANEYLSILKSLNATSDTILYGMPILEGPRVAYHESRRAELMSLKEIIKPFKDLVLNIRIGGTDFSSLFSVRRGINYSIYDILPIKDCIGDILNYFCRQEDNYTISGPVWEYFLAYNKDDLQTLIKNDIHHSIMTRETIINGAIDGLLREVIIDKANGMVGKTIIHPSHARFVNALQAVTKEEYDDANQILDALGGVVKSTKENKMNEINPHRNWAKKIMCRAAAYGVIEDDLSYLKLIFGDSSPAS